MTKVTESDKPFGVSCLHNCPRFFDVCNSSTFQVEGCSVLKRPRSDGSKSSREDCRIGLHHGNKSLKVQPNPKG